MTTAIQENIADAIRRGDWKNPGSDALQQILGPELKLPELELFEDVDTMQRVSEQIAAAGYVDDPEFCMILSTDLKLGRDDERLVFGNALFIGGSIVPGDDVFIVVEIREEVTMEQVRVFDWRKEAPNRWTTIGSLDDFVGRIADFETGDSAL